MLVVSQGVEHLDVAVLDGKTKGLPRASRLGPAPEIRFQAGEPGLRLLFIGNAANTEALIAVTRLKK
jgi:hypothetical protein